MAPARDADVVVSGGIVQERSKTDCLVEPAVSGAGERGGTDGCVDSAAGGGTRYPERVAKTNPRRRSG